ncbi:MAG: AI-2E family transporter [Muribaculaceae bacterium]|nr:AI-2E family transporter [Muribaculaceae bacterium]MDE6682367.1 AI-2E family transporter [Muribaculaceae bacterium]
MKPFTFDRFVRLLITLALIAGTIWLLGILKNVLLPFCLACLLAYIMEPFVEFNQRFLHSKKWGWAVAVTLVDVTVIAGALIYFIAPLMEGEIHELGAMIDRYQARNVKIPMLPESFTDMMERHLDLRGIVADIESGKWNTWLDKGETIVSGSIDFLMHSLEWLLTFVYLIFVLIDYHKLGSGFRMMVPDKYKATVFRLAHDIKYSMNEYFRGQLVIASCAAVFYCIGFSIVGLPMAIMMGLLVGILYMIPYFQYITLIPVAIICFITSLDGGIDFWTMLGECGLVYVVSQSICDYILTPKIMGKSLGLNPAVILLSLSIWGTLLGILGMVIALPLTTLLTAYYKKIVIEHQPIWAETRSDSEKNKMD